MFGTYALEMKRLYSFGSTAGTLALLLAGLACVGAARPGRVAPEGIELLAPTTITISNFPIHAALVFQLIREVYAEEGVTLPAMQKGTPSSFPLRSREADTKLSIARGCAQVRGRTSCHWMRFTAPREIR